MSAEYKAFPVRELLERQTYMGPISDEGQGMTKSYDWTSAVTGANLWVPTLGNRFIISLITINTSATCTVTIFDGTDNTENRIFKGQVAAGTVIIPYPIPRNSATIDNSLKVTTSATGGFITVWGWEGSRGDESTTTTTISTSSSSSSSSTTT